MASPYEVLSTFIDKAQSGFFQASCTMVSVQTAGSDTSLAVVGYSVGNYPSDMSPSGALTATGALTQYFSDRRGPRPFGGVTDSATLTLACDPARLTASVTLELNSWGHARQDIQNLRVENGLLLGDGPSVGGAAPMALYIFALDLSLIVDLDDGRDTGGGDFTDDVVR